MKHVPIALAAALALAGCEGPEDQIENSIRAELGKQAEVQEVEMTRQADGTMTGHAMVREANGRVGRLNCTAEPADDSNYNWRCSPAIDEQTLAEMEEVIRADLAQQATVVEVDMQRADDDDHMTGHALLRDAQGNEARIPCTAERDSERTGFFNWQCGEEQAGG